VTVVESTRGVGQPIVSAAAIGKTVERLADSIAADHRGKPLLLLGVLKGALLLTADLARALAAKSDGPSEIMVDYLCAQRYGSLGTSGGEVRLRMDCGLPVKGANVVLVDDVADNGRTIEYLQTLLRGRGPASLRTCVLFDKPARREVDVRIDYLGMEVPNVFIIGYGLDYKELYRNIPHLAELREGQTV
jgi:hypoxanthine phosphoribosyltransferase